jgi:UDPglucose--hexose-1-phosphate uridylyltransferase
MLDLRKHSHRRYNALTGEWVLVSPHRTDRPWQGQVEDLQQESLPEYDPQCYLCPGNSRAGGAKNPRYETTFVFENDFAALTANTPAETINTNDLMIAEGEAGICRVLCFSPRHDLTISRMDEMALRRVVDLWIEQFQELGSREEINWVQIFENRGAMMGASNPHPHGQIWANRSLPNEAVKELNSQQRYRSENGSCLLCDYVAAELLDKLRVVFESDCFVIVVPFWAIWPFETLILPKRHDSAIDQLNETERNDLGMALKRITATYDNLFKAPFSYTMGFHQRPTDGKAHDAFHWHVHFFPPLLRSATVRKFMVGYELLSMPQRDITPEAAAERLRDAAI